ncbi:MAG: TonB-dependent receptor [Gemmatimonadota bacterium]
MKLFTRLASITFALALTVTHAAAVQAQQEGPARGRIMGQVKSQETGASLSGAQIQIEGSPRGTLSGIEGRYQMDDLPVGPLSLRVTYLGYAAKVISGVEIVAGQTARLDVTLERQAVEMAAITVTAQQERGSSVTLIGAQRSAISLVSAISAEQIGRSPDGDAAAAMQRVSGVTVQDGKFVQVRGMGQRYTTSSLNGLRIPSPDPERKTVPLDLFPSGLIQSISTSKTFTPDQPGDFSGGSVDIRTPDFPTRRTYSLSIGSGYHPDVVGNTLLVAPSAGTEWLASGANARSLPAAARNFSGTETRGPEVNSIVNSFRNAWSVREKSGRLPASLSASIGGSGDFMGRTIGYLGSASYSNSQEVKLEQRRARWAAGDSEVDRYDGEASAGTVSMGALLNLSLLFGSHSQVHLNNTMSRSADDQARREIGFDENSASTVQVERLSYVERTVRSHQLQGEHQLGLRHRLDWLVSNSAVSRSEPDRSEFVTWLDPEQPIWLKNFEGAVRTFGSLDESALEGSARYAFTFGGNPGQPNRINIGVGHRRVGRDAESIGFRIQPFFWSPSDERWQMAPEEIFDGRFAQEGDSIFILAPEQAGGSYDADDRLYSGFLMGEVNVTERLRLIGGVRVENYELDLNAVNAVGVSSDVTRSYTDFLPALSALIQLPGEQQVRLSASQTLARPEYRELAPINYREVLGGEQVRGDANLERTLIRNLDLRWEWYPRVGEVISVGIFGKWFENPIEERYIGGSGTSTRTFANAESAANFGVELDVNRSLDWIHPALEPLSVFGNLTLMKSEVDTGQEGEEARALVGQAPYVVNSGLTYFNALRGLSATVLFNVVGDRVLNARAVGATYEDVVERPRPLVDLSFRFPVIGAASGKLDLKNILDSPYEVLQGPIVRDYHRSGRSVSFGLSWQW